MRQQITCQSYEQSIYELFLPSPVIFSSLCFSQDKTNLFICSFIRLIFYLIIYYVIIDICKNNDYKNSNIDNFFITMIIINVIYIGFIVTKIPSIDKSNSIIAQTQ